MNFSDKSDFVEYLKLHPENGVAFSGIENNKPYDLNFRDFDSLKPIHISFGEYTDFLVFIHPETNEVFLGDVNTGGHAARCRIVKVGRGNLVYNSKVMKKWYENWAWEIWK